MKSLRLFSFIGLCAFASFLVMVSPASAGISFGIDNGGGGIHSAQPYQLAAIDNESKPIVIADGGSTIVSPSGRHTSNEEQFIKDGGGIAGHRMKAHLMALTWSGGGGFGPRGTSFNSI